MKYGTKEMIEKFIDRRYDPSQSLLSVVKCGETSQVLPDDDEIINHIINLLLLQGADINAKDKYRDSVLTCAVYYGSPIDVINFLLSKGSDIDLDTNSVDFKRYCAKLVSSKVLQTLERWPLSMAIIVLQELAIYYQIDASSVIDLWQLLGSF